MSCQQIRADFRTLLDTIPVQTLRLSMGPVKISPVCALQVEAGEMPLWLKRKQEAANYWIHSRGQRDAHLTKGVQLVGWEKETAQKGSLGWKGDEEAEDMGLNNQVFEETLMRPCSPVWLCDRQEIDLELLKDKHEKKNSGIKSRSSVDREIK